MNRAKAKELAETVTNKQLQEMFDNAKAKIIDWKRKSNVNRTMTKGTAWNILAADFDVNHNYNLVAKRNMIWEFGDFLPKGKGTDLKVKEIKEKIKLFHQEPKFK